MGVLHVVVPDSAMLSGAVEGGSASDPLRELMQEQRERIWSWIDACMHGHPLSSPALFGTHAHAPPLVTATNTESGEATPERDETRNLSTFEQLQAVWRRRLSPPDRGTERRGHGVQGPFADGRHPHPTQPPPPALPLPHAAPPPAPGMKWELVVRTDKVGTGVELSNSALVAALQAGGREGVGKDSGGHGRTPASMHASTLSQGRAQTLLAPHHPVELRRQDLETLRDANIRYDCFVRLGEQFFAPAPPQRAHQVTTSYICVRTRNAPLCVCVCV